MTIAAPAPPCRVPHLWFPKHCPAVITVPRSPSAALPPSPPSNAVLSTLSSSPHQCHSCAYPGASRVSGRALYGHAVLSCAVLGCSRLAWAWCDWYGAALLFSSPLPTLSSSSPVLPNAGVSFLGVQHIVLGVACPTRRDARRAGPVMRACVRAYLGKVACVRALR